MERETEAKVYRVYVTDALKCVAENTMRFVGGESMRERWYNVLHPKPEDTRTEAEIVGNIRAKLEAMKGGE